MKARTLLTHSGVLCVLLVVANGVSADTCDDVVAVINKSRTLAELRSRAQSMKLNNADARKCESSLQRSVKLQQLLNTEKRRVASVTRSRSTAVQRKIKKPEALNINRRALQLRTEVKNKLSQLQRASRLTKPTATVPSKKSTAPAQPIISAVTPSTLVPGTDVVIEGQHFGNAQGSVQLKLQGKTFNATINAWNDTWVNAYLSDSVSGVMPSDNAVISVQVPQGTTVNHNIPFIPLYVQESATEDYDSPGSLIFPGSGTTTVFRGKSLNNGWLVSEYSVTAEPDLGECELGTPSMSAGGEHLESQLKWSYDWWQGFAWCHVDVYAEGPQGINSGL